MKIILKNDKIVIDSENTVFHFVMKWLKYDLVNRKQYADKLLSYVQFSKMKLYYLMDVVPHCIDKFLDEPVKTKYMRKYSEALECICGGERRHKKQCSPQTKINRVIDPHPHHNIISFKCNFTLPLNPTSYDYDSQPFFSHGFFCIFYMRPTLMYATVRREHEVPAMTEYTFWLYDKIVTNLGPEKVHIPVHITRTLHYRNINLVMSVRVVSESHLHDISLGPCLPP